MGGFGVNVGGHGLAYANDTNQLLMTNFNTDTLYSVNPLTGSATAIGTTQFGGVVALAFNPETNRLFGVDVNTDQLIEFDRQTGGGTAVGALGVDVFNVGLAFEVSAVPEPACFLPCLLGATVVMFRRKRSC